MKLGQKKARLIESGCGIAASTVHNLEDSLLATASAVTICANYIHYAIII